MLRRDFRSAYLDALGAGLNPLDQTTNHILGVQLSLTNQRQLERSKRRPVLPPNPKTIHAATVRNQADPNKPTTQNLEPKTEEQIPEARKLNEADQRRLDALQRIQAMQSMYRQYGENFFKTNPVPKSRPAGSLKNITQHQNQINWYLGPSHEERMALAEQLAKKVNSGENNVIGILNALVNYLVNQSQEFVKHLTEIQALKATLKCESIIHSIHETLLACAKQITQQGITQQISKYRDIHPQLNSDIEFWLNFLHTNSAIKLP